MSRYPMDSSYGRSRPLDYTGEKTAIASFFNMVYAWMAAGLALTAVVAY